jgi:hypothetical protein
MEWAPFLILVPIICFGLAYGFQKRTRWAWYAGWVVLFFFAGAVALYTTAMLFSAQTVPQFILAAVFTTGGAALWTLFAVRWCAYKTKFFSRHQTGKGQ